MCYESLFYIHYFGYLLVEFVQFVEELGVGGAVVHFFEEGGVGSAEGLEHGYAAAAEGLVTFVRC